MGKSIAIFNQKGGVGKTTTNINLAACLAKKGKKVLILDIDPQGNTTSGIGVAKRNLKNTVYTILIDKNYDPRKAIIHTTTENLDLIPASVDLAGAIVLNDKGDAVFGFGKYKDKSVVDILKQDPGYYSWMENGKFTEYTKRVLRDIRVHPEKYKK